MQNLILKYFRMRNFQKLLEYSANHSNQENMYSKLLPLHITVKNGFDYIYIQYKYITGLFPLHPVYTYNR